MASNKKKPKLSLAVIDTPRARQIIYALGVVILVAIALLKVKPNLDEEKTLQAATVQVQAEQQQQEQELKALQESKAKRGNRAQQLSQVILQALPTDVQNDAVLRQLQALANTTNVTLSSFQPAAPADGGLVRKLNVTLALSGRYEDLLRFVNGLTSQTQINKKRNTISAVGPIWSVENIALTPGSGTTDPNADPNAPTDPDLMSASITGTLYLSPLTNADPASAPGVPTASGPPAAPTPAMP